MVGKTIVVADILPTGVVEAWVALNHSGQGSNPWWGTMKRFTNSLLLTCCAWETAALSTGKIPTITATVHRTKLVGAIIWSILWSIFALLHFVYPLTKITGVMSDP